MAHGRHREPQRPAASGRRTVDRARRLPSSREYDRYSCGRRNKRGAPETFRRLRPAIRSRRCWGTRVAPRHSRRPSPLPGHLPVVPIENLFAVPVQDAVALVDVMVDRFEIFDAERLTADVGMDRERQDFRPSLTFLVEPVEAVYWR